MRTIVCLALVAVARAAYIESVAAAIDAAPSSSKSSQHASIEPMVAFQCGFKNQYVNKDGKWVSDKTAGCKSEKFDVLRYCRERYPDLDITNIVEYSQRVHLENWCKEDSSACKWQHTVRPYRCIVGEFKNAALQVPRGCRFGHVDEETSCEDFSYWQETAQDECGRRVGDDKRTMRVRSFAVLQPCSVGRFSAVEYVCCPQTADVPHHKPTTTEAPVDEKPLLDTHQNERLTARQFESDIYDEDDDSEDSSSWENDSSEEDDDEYFSDEDEDDYEDDEKQDAIIMKELRQEAATLDKDADSTTVAPETHTEEQKALLGADDGHDDPYFRRADPLNEHALHKEAVARLEARHSAKVKEVMKQWAETQNQYERLLVTDPRRAKEYHARTKEDFHRTVAALDAEIRNQRSQLDEVHQQRVQARLNEGKRDAIRAYRDVLAAAITQPRPHAVLGALKTYVRAEEKDRTHLLARYRHLLKSDVHAARAQRRQLLRRLRDIDLRINGTMTMLNDFKEMVDKVRPVAIQFWREYREANTPATEDVRATEIAPNGDYEKALGVYERLVREELGDEPREPSTAELSPELVEELGVLPGIEPVLTVQEHLEAAAANARADKLVARSDEGVYMPQANHGYARHGLLYAFAGMASLVLVVALAMHRRRAAARRGFIEVDLYTPEERHVAGMQHNGYENPTYSYFGNEQPPNPLAKA